MQLNGGECRYHTLHQNIDARSQTVQIYIYIIWKTLPTLVVLQSERYASII